MGECFFIASAIKGFARYASHIYFQKKEEKNQKKKEKRKPFDRRGSVLSRFFQEILPDKGGVEIF